MYTLTDQDWKSIKAAFGADQPSINGVSITDLIMELSEINSGNVVVAPIIEAEIEAPIAEAQIVEEPIAEAPIEAPVETPIVDITA